RRPSDLGGTGPIVLAIIAAVNTVVAFYYYARVVKAVWLDPIPEGVEVREQTAPAGSLSLALGLTTALTVIIGIFPAIATVFADASQVLTAVGGRADPRPRFDPRAGGPRRMIRLDPASTGGHPRKGRHGHLVHGSGGVGACHREEAALTYGGDRRDDRADRAAQPDAQRHRLQGLRRGPGACPPDRRGPRPTGNDRSSRRSARRHERPLRLQARVASHLRWDPGDERLLDRRLLRVGRAHGSGGSDHRRQREQPGHGVPRRLRQLPVRPDRQPFRRHPQLGRLVGWLGGGRGRRPGATGRGYGRRRIDPHPFRLVRGLRVPAVAQPGADRGPSQR